MAGIFSLLITLTISLIVTRVAAMALMYTGLSREVARFQARSAFSGVGFSTSESECIVNHPVRRRVIMVLMLMGNIGIATVIATVMISFSSTISADIPQQLLALAILSVGLGGLWYLSTSRWVERRMNKLIAWALRRFTDLDVRDYVALLNLSDGYGVTEMAIGPKHWLAGGTLRDLRLSDEGILVLGIRRADATYRGIPRGIDRIDAGDVLVLYGQMQDIHAVDRRKPGPVGEKQHKKAVKRRESDSSAATQQGISQQDSVSTAAQSDASNQLN